MIKLTLQVTPELDAVIERLATERSVPKSQILRRAVALMDYLDDGAKHDKDILLRDSNTGETEKLVLETSLSRKN